MKRLVSWLMGGVLLAGLLLGGAVLSEALGAALEQQFHAGLPPGLTGAPTVGVEGRGVRGWLAGGGASGGMGRAFGGHGQRYGSGGTSTMRRDRQDPIVFGQRDRRRMDRPCPLRRSAGPR